MSRPTLPAEENLVKLKFCRCPLLIYDCFAANHMHDPLTVTFEPLTFTSNVV